MAEIFRVSRSFLSLTRTSFRISRWYSTAPEPKNSCDTEFIPDPVPDTFKRILDIFPQDMEMAFAYGSGVFQQKGEQDFEKKMLDFIFVVDDPKSWHRENMSLNKSHYSYLARMSRPLIGKVQSYGAGVYFNTDIPFEDRKIKYGVISTDTLIQDLIKWNTLYISGRLQKPVKIIKFPNNNKLNQALAINLKSAFHAAVLMLPEYSSEMDLYKWITSLSYLGDVRMGLAEDSNKVNNIVSTNVYRFRELYGDILASERHLNWHREEEKIERSLTQVSQEHHVSLLPSTVLKNLRAGRSEKNIEDVIHAISNDSSCPDLVEKAVKSIVQKSSSRQSLKGLYMAGFSKSLAYLGRKMTKKIKS